MKTENWLHNTWKWFIPISFFILCIVFFFSVTGNTIFKYGSIYLQPELIENARVIANKNIEVQNVFGNLHSKNLLNLIEGKIKFSEHPDTVAISIKLNGDKQKGILDIWAYRLNEAWQYDSIAVRTKTPKNSRILVLKE